jgi:hypothetical protein
MFGGAGGWTRASDARPSDIMIPPHPWDCNPACRESWISGRPIWTEPSMPVSRHRAAALAGNAAPPGPPDRLRPYAYHGVDLAVRGSQAVGDCPFCSREGKFSVEVATGLWRCFVCGGGTAGGGGNPLGFLRLLYERAAGSPAPGIATPARNGHAGHPPGPTGDRPASVIVAGRNGHPGPTPPASLATRVAANRRLLDPATVVAWGVRESRDGTWLVPGYSAEGRLDQIYRRTRVQENGEWVWRLLPTPGVWPEGKVHALHLPVADFDPSRPNVVICEGPWDGMALYEVWDDRDFGKPLLHTNIIAVPGCNVWRDEWTPLCRGKDVTLMFDSDHPRGQPGGRRSRAGYDGMTRVARRLSGVAQSVRYVRWGEDGYDPARPSGWDVRDFLTEE